MKSTILEIKDLKKYYHVERGFLSNKKAVIKAVNGVNLKIFKKEIMGLVGESGCGKSTLGRLIAKLDEPTEGCIYFNSENIVGYTGNKLKNYRKKVQIIFQDPYSSLNPRRSAIDTIREPLLIFNYNRTEQNLHAMKLMELVGLNMDQAERYPHEFSGGQRQRIGIARALVLQPELVICDEPVSSLDVSIQAQILNLMKDLQKEFGLTYLFISHDLSVVRHMSDRIAVMYLGKIVELAENSKLYQNSLHPYTKALLSAVPIPEPKKDRKERIILDGDIPSPINLPEGCSFHPRCSFRFDKCSLVEPNLIDISDGHYVACHLVK